MNRELETELLRRRDLDQAARSAFDGRDAQELKRLIAMDDDNAAWLSRVIEESGWPGISTVGEEGAHAAWLLAQHADRYPALQRRCLRLLEEAVAAGEASAADLAYLTDRVLLGSGRQQLYGTQLAAREGRLLPGRLLDPETVDQRRAAMGLEPLAAQVARALERYGPPRPASMPCPRCQANCEVWLPEMRGTSTHRCPSCGYEITLRARMRHGRAMLQPKA